MMCAKATVALHWRGKIQGSGTSDHDSIKAFKNINSYSHSYCSTWKFKPWDTMRYESPLTPARASLVHLEISATCMASHSHWTGLLPGYDDPFWPVQVVYLSFMLSYRRSPTPKDHVQQYRSRSDIVNRRPSETYGMDSPMGLLLSNIFASMHIYTALRRKFDAWEKLLRTVPDNVFLEPCLDVGCGRGMIFVMIARRKKLLSASALQTVEPVYAIDIFDGCNQARSCPEGTCQNLAAQNVLDHAVLHTASFCNMPFVDDSFAFISSSLSLHNASTKDQKAGILECARVLKPGGMILVVDLFPRVTFYAKWLIKIGWIDVSTMWSGAKMVCGVLPCQTMRAIKPLQ